jgi:hypothetical protein
MGYKVLFPCGYFLRTFRTQFEVTEEYPPNLRVLTDESQFKFVNDGDNRLCGGRGYTNNSAVSTPVLVSYPVLTRAVPCRVASTLIRPAAGSLPRLLSAHTNQVIPLSVKRCSLPARSSDLRAPGTVDIQELRWPLTPQDARSVYVLARLEALGSWFTVLWRVMPCSLLPVTVLSD